MANKKYVSGHTQRGTKIVSGGASTVKVGAQKPPKHSGSGAKR